MFPSRNNRIQILMLLVISSLCFVDLAEARLGETPLQFSDLYGDSERDKVTQSRQKHFPLAPKGSKPIEKVWTWKGWEIKAVFPDTMSGAVIVQYHKLPGNATGHRMDERELKSLLDGNPGQGQKWKEDSFKSSVVKSTGALEKVMEGHILGMAGAKAWMRDDSMVAGLMVGGTTLQIYDPRVTVTAKPVAGPLP